LGAAGRFEPTPLCAVAAAVLVSGVLLSPGDADGVFAEYAPHHTMWNAAK
jgi:hypothetical protein